MKQTFSFVVLTLLLGATLAAAEAAAPAKALPNIIYILADDLGYGDVQALNPQRGKIPTPHIDKLAAAGMTFVDAHSGSSVCTPTRYGVLTGRYAWRTKLQSGVLDGYVTPLIAEDRLTVPALLKEFGYHSACIGKWHLGYTIEGADKTGGNKAKGKNKDKTNDERNQSKGVGAPLGAITRDGPTTRGFDTFFGFHHARMIKSLFENDRVTQIIEPVEMLPLLTKRAEIYIAERAKSGAPFFLYLPLNSPHTPIVPSKEWQGKSGLGAYGDFVMETDWAIGQVLAALDRAGIADNTLVIMTSDNGCSPAAKTDQLEKEGHFASAQYRGYKSDIWDGGHRVPFIVRWPVQVKAGSQCAQTICHTDLLATAADIVGKKLPDNAGEDSVSFVPALHGQTIPATRAAVVHHSISGKFAIRQANWKLELCAGSGGWSKGGDKESPQLYDMAADPGEMTNLAKEKPEIVAKLAKLLEQYVSAGRSTPGAAQTNDVDVKVLKANGMAPVE